MDQYLPNFTFLTYHLPFRQEARNGETQDFKTNARHSGSKRRVQSEQEYRKARKATNEGLGEANPRLHIQAQPPDESYEPASAYPHSNVGYVEDMGSTTPANIIQRA
jgi:hypothetical protein